MTEIRRGVTSTSIVKGSQTLSLKNFGKTSISVSAEAQKALTDAGYTLA